MSQVAVYKTQLLSDLASAIGVSADVAKTNAKLLADSYNSARVYAGSDEKAFEWLKADPRTNLGGKFDKQILEMSLAYIKQTEGHIASDDYVKNAREERAKTNLDSQLAEINRKTGSDLSVKNTTYKKRVPTDMTYASEPVYLGIGFGGLQRLWDRIPKPSRQTFSNTRQYINTHPRRFLYPLLGGAAILGALSFSYMQGVKPNQIVSFYTGKAKPAVVRVVEPQKPKLVEVKPKPGVATPTPSSPKAEPTPAARAPTPAQSTYQDLVRRIEELGKDRVTQQDYQALKAGVDKLRKDYNTLIGKVDGFEGEFKEVRDKLTNLEGIVQQISVQAPAATVAPAAAKATVKKADLVKEVADHSTYKWVFKQRGSEHDEYSPLRTKKFSELSPDVQAWYSLQPIKVEFKSEAPKYFVAIAMKTTYKGTDKGKFMGAVKLGKWNYGLTFDNQKIIPVTKDLLEALRNGKILPQSMMYQSDDMNRILNIYASVNPGGRVPQVKLEEPRPEIRKPEAPEPIKPSVHAPELRVPKIEQPKPVAPTPEAPKKPELKRGIPFEPEHLTAPQALGEGVLTGKTGEYNFGGIDFIPEHLTNPTGR